VLERELQPQMDAGRVKVLLQTKASALVQKRAGGAVTGVTATGPDGATVEYCGRSVVLTSGGYLRGAEMRQPLFNAVLQDDAVPSPMLLRPVTDPLQRPPWEIFVNVRGERFLFEDTPSFDAKE
jgi:fumarate reductase flavoprotein subunit